MALPVFQFGSFSRIPSVRYGYGTALLNSPRDLHDTLLSNSWWYQFDCWRTINKLLYIITRTFFFFNVKLKAHRMPLHFIQTPGWISSYVSSSRWSNTLENKMDSSLKKNGKFASASLLFNVRDRMSSVSSAGKRQPWPHDAGACTVLSQLEMLTGPCKPETGSNCFSAGL